MLYGLPHLHVLHIRYQSIHEFRHNPAKLSDLPKQCDRELQKRLCKLRGSTALLSSTANHKTWDKAFIIWQRIHDAGEVVSSKMHEPIAEV